MARTVLVDFHCHLDLYPDHGGAVAECERAGIFTLTVTTTPKAWTHNKALTARTRHVRAALGLHPQLAAEHSDELALWEQLLPETRYVGEVGLDAGPRFYRSLDAQKYVFTRVLQACARAGNKILTVHSVRSAKTVLDMVEALLPPSQGQVVLHWFTGSHAEARRAIDLGCYFSINAEMLANERHCAMVVALPMDRLLTETDGPFTKISGVPTRPPDVEATVRALAQARSTPAGVLATAIHTNLRRLVLENGSA